MKKVIFIFFFILIGNIKIGICQSTDVIYVAIKMPSSFEPLCDHFQLDKQYWPYIEIHIVCPRLRKGSVFTRIACTPAKVDVIDVPGEAVHYFYSPIDIEDLVDDVAIIPLMVEGQILYLKLPRFNYTMYFSLCNNDDGRHTCRNNIDVNGLSDYKPNDYFHLEPDLLCH